MNEVERVYRANGTDAEIAEVLAQRLVATVGTVNKNGSVHLANVIFLYARGLLYFETASITRKARNAKRTGQASMLVQGRAAATGRTLMVSVEGTARVVYGDEAHAVNHELRAKYIKDDALPDIDRVWERLDDVAVEITPQAWRSWHGTVLHEVTQQDLTVPYQDVWIEG